MEINNSRGDIKLKFGHSGHLCRSCYNCKGRYCYIGERWTFFIACKLWFSKDLRKGAPAIINLVKKLEELNKEKGQAKEYKRLWQVAMNLLIDKTDEIYELKRCDYKLEGY